MLQFLCRFPRRSLLFAIDILLSEVPDDPPPRCSLGLWAHLMSCARRETGDRSVGVKGLAGMNSSPQAAEVVDYRLRSAS